MTITQSVPRLGALLCAATVLACDDSTEPVVLTPAAIEATADARVEQTAVVGTPVTNAPAVVVTDASGRAVADVPVTFTVASGGGMLGSTNVVTDATGTASSALWTLGTQAGPNTVTASAAGLDPVTFTAVGEAGAATSLTANVGVTQRGVVGATPAELPSVLIADVHGNPVADFPVTFAAGVGGGSITGGSVSTDAEGVASLGGWTLGTRPGVNTVTVSAGDLPEMTFAATAEAGPAAQVEKVFGDEQTGVTGQAVSMQPTVRILDEFGNPRSDADVTFSVLSGGGTITGGTTRSDVGGFARLEGWTLGAVGENTLQAATPGVGPVIFTATADAATVRGN